MLELIFQGFMEWAYGLTLECWEYFSSSLLSIMSMDYAYMKSHVPVMVSIAQVLLAVGWALLIGNLVFQALKSMAVGLGFEGEDPKLLFTRTFVFAFLLMASPQICEVGLSLTARIIELLEIPDAIDVTLVDEGAFGSLNAAWLLVIIFGLIIMFKVFRLLLEIAERYVILAVLTMTAPLAFAMGGSKSTSEIFGGWCRMFGSTSPSAFRYAVRYEGHTDLAPYEFFECCNEKSDDEILGAAVQHYDVVEIDDGIKPAFFYKTEHGYELLFSFDAKTAKKNIREEID